MLPERPKRGRGRPRRAGADEEILTVALAMLRECSSVKYDYPSRPVNVTRRSHLHIESIGKCAFDHAQS